MDYTLSDYDWVRQVRYAKRLLIKIDAARGMADDGRHQLIEAKHALTEAKRGAGDSEAKPVPVEAKHEAVGAKRGMPHSAASWELTTPMPLRRDSAA